MDAIVTPLPSAMQDSANTDTDLVSALVHPIPLESFKQDFWPMRFRHAERAGEGLKELIEAPEFANVENLFHCPIAGSIRADYTRIDRDSEGDITPERALELYRDACTIFLSRIANEPAKRWARALDREFGLIPGTTQINAFASIPGRGLSWHWDPQEVFIVQLHGRKRWHVAPNEHIEWPTASGQAGAERRPEIRCQLKDPSRPVEKPREWQTIDLVPGSVMFMPRGYWHTTENIDESIHLVLQMKMPSWRDVFAFLFQSVPELYGLDWRRPTTALNPQNLLNEGVREMRERCEQLTGFATVEKMAALGKAFGGIRG